MIDRDRFSDVPATARPADTALPAPKHSVVDACDSTRRTLLRGLVGLMAAAGLAGCGGLRSAGGGRSIAGQPLLAFLFDRDAAARFGAAYLREHPDERDPDRLLAEIARAVGTVPPGASTVALGEALRSVVSAEFRRGEVVVVQRWMLGRTEARVYAVAALAAPD